jgi:hypothetical protein
MLVKDKIYKNNCISLTYYILVTEKKIYVNFKTMEIRRNNMHFLSTEKKRHRYDIQ